MSLIFAGKVNKGDKGFSHGKFESKESSQDAYQQGLLPSKRHKKTYEYPVVSADNKKVDGFKVIRGTSLTKESDLGNVRMFFEPLAKKNIDSDVGSVIPIGNQTEVVTAVEAIKELFPHTSKRLPKETMRNHLFQKQIQTNYERDIEPLIVEMN